MTIQTGIKAARKAADKAESLCEGWKQDAFEALVEFFKQSPDSEFTIEQARERCPQMPIGADARAWGNITRRAIRERVIEKTGSYSPAISSNGSPKPLYRYVNLDKTT